MQLTKIFTATVAALVTTVPVVEADGHGLNLIKLLTELFSPGTAGGAHNPHAHIGSRAIPFVDGGSEALVRRADSGLPHGIPQYVLDGCRNQTQAAKPEAKKEGANNLRATKVPAECMSFAAYWTEASAPHPCGNDCLLYEGLNSTQMDTVVNAAKQLLPGINIS